MTITPDQVRAVVLAQTSLQSFPLNEPFINLGLTNAQLVAVQAKLAKLFNRTVRTIYFKDTVYTLTDRLNEKQSPS